MDNKTKKSTGNQISSKDNVILHLSDLHFGYDENQQKKADREIVLKELRQLDKNNRPKLDV